MRLLSNCCAIPIAGAISLLLSLTSTAGAVSIDWATIGDPGNAADPKNNSGAVGYEFRLSKHEVTNSQYVEFLNAVAQDDKFDLYNSFEANSTTYGIDRSGSPGSYTYSVKAAVPGEGPGGTDYTYEQKPVSSVNFFSILRFVNWLENGQPTGPQGPSTTESGAYLLSEGTAVTRTPGASYFLPTNDEWYKAAYYDPTSGQYYSYPTSSDTPPDDRPDGGPRDTADPMNVANYSASPFFYPKTDVGSFDQTTSPSGLFDMAGNVAEWNESLMGASSRVIRGGSWADLNTTNMNSLISLSGPVGIAYIGTGFRVGSAIPEPTSLVLGLAGIAAVSLGRRQIAGSRVIC